MRPFDAFWAGYNSPDCTPDDRQNAEMIWGAATLAERERCAKLAEKITRHNIDNPDDQLNFAAAIRKGPQ